MASSSGDDLIWSGEALPAAVPRLLSDGLERIRHGTMRAGVPLLHVDQRHTARYVLAWKVVDPARGLNRPVIGFVADPSLLTPVFARILKDSPLLPPSLARDTRELLSVKVLTADGDQLFASSTAWSQYASETVLENELGGLRAAVALQPSAADRLIIGGLPRNRVPLLAGLLVLTTGLLLVALVQFQRERELVRLRADFISGVSHELRTPVAQIRMFGETLLLDRVRSPEERRRSLAIVVQEAQRLTHLIDNVLHFSRADRGAPAVILTAGRLDLLLHEIVDGFEPLARSKRTTIARRIEDGVVVPVDGAALRQIVINLLDNALKYGPAGQAITVGCVRQNSEAVISIEDEGPGVALGDAARIWEPFYRATSHAASTGGTGIGLATVKHLVDLHHGRVRVERGTTGARFIVALPGASHADVGSERRQATAAGA